MKRPNMTKEQKAAFDRWGITEDEYWQVLYAAKKAHPDWAQEDLLHYIMEWTEQRAWECLKREGKLP